MNGFAAILRRELAEKRLVVAGAAVVGILPFLAPLVRFGESSPSEVRLVAAQVFAGAFTFFAVLYVSVTAFSTELAQRRLGFYLSTPAGMGALFGGKLVAASLLATLCFAIVVVPTAIFDQFTSLPEHSGFFAGLLAVLIIPALIYASVALRSRSWWIALDVAGSAALTAFLLWIVRQPERLTGFRFSDGFFPLGLLLILIAAVAVPLLATFAGLTRGRASIVAWHSAAAITLWTLLVVLSAAAFGAILWLRSVPLRSFDDFMVGNASAQGRWAAITGFGPWRLNHQRSFLVDARGTTIAVGSERAVVSRDGSRAAWLEPASDGTSTGLFVKLLAGDDREPRHVADVSERSWRIAISDSGSRVAVASAAGVSVFDSSTGRMVAAFGKSCSERRRLFFVTEDSVRLYCHDSARLSILELNVPRRKIQLTGAMPLSKDTSFHLDSSGARMLLFTWAQPGLKRSTIIADARTGKVMANVVSVALGPRFLSDGRIAAFQESREQLSLTIFSPAGDPERVIELGRGRLARSGMQPSPSQLWVTVFEGEERGRLLLVDLEAGRVIRQINRPLNPMFAFHAHTGDDPRSLTAPDFANVFIDRWSVVRVDPGTGEIKTFLGPRP